MARTATLMRPHIEGILTALETTTVPSIATTIPHPIGEWLRPRQPAVGDPDTDLRYVDPPFINARIFPSAGDFDGPIDDSQADIKVRIQIQSVGLTDIQALQVLDLTREIMADKDNITIANRYIQAVKLMIVSGGVSRDDDIIPPVFYDFDVYEVWTTPA